MLWYLTFVGLPLLALLVVLRIGEGLTAPHAVHGVYVAAFDSTSENSCWAELLPQPSDIVVHQSGTRLDVEIGDLILVGAIRRDSLAASSRRNSTILRAAGCLTVDSLTLHAVLAREGTAKQLTGRLVFVGCQNCAPAIFRATRSADRSRAKGV